MTHPTILRHRRPAGWQDVASARQIHLAGQGGQVRTQLDHHLQAAVRRWRWDESDLAVAEPSVATPDGFEDLELHLAGTDLPGIGRWDPTGQAAPCAEVHPCEPQVRPAIPAFERQEQQTVTAGDPQLVAEREDAAGCRRPRALRWQVRKAHGHLQVDGRVTDVVGRRAVRRRTPVRRTLPSGP